LAQVSSPPIVARLPISWEYKKVFDLQIKDINTTKKWLM